MPGVLLNWLEGVAGSGWRSESPLTYMPAITGELMLGGQR